MSAENPLRPRPRGVTISHLMVLALAIALVIGGLRIKNAEPRFQRGLGVGLVVLLVARVMLMILHAQRCPACGEGPVGTVAAVPFGDHYFRCAACGQRSKRFWLGRLWDASGPEDDRRYAKAPGVSTWAHGPIVPTPDDPNAATVGRLLLDKLDREAESEGEPVVVGTIASPPRANLPDPSGVQGSVAERFSRTLDVIRWSRRPRS